MHIVARRKLRDFWRLHPPAEDALRHWCAVAEHLSPGDLRLTFPEAEYIAPYTVFAIPDTAHRVVAVIHRDPRRLYVRKVMAQADYERWREDEQGRDPG